MTTQPTALFLADVLANDPFSKVHHHRAADELRRLVAQRDALLKALKGIDKEFKKNGRQHWPEAVKARAAIAKAEGQQ